MNLFWPLYSLFKLAWWVRYFSRFSVDLNYSNKLSERCVLDFGERERREGGGGGSQLTARDFGV